MKRNAIYLISLLLLALGQCKSPEKEQEQAEVAAPEEENLTAVRPEIYAEVALTTDVSQLSKAEQQMLSKMIEAAKIMDRLFWLQANGVPEAELMAQLKAPEVKEFARINYGPWDRLAGNQPFVPGVGPKPLGAFFYPQDMDKAEFEAADLPDKKSLYTLIERDEAGNLITVPYHEAYQEALNQAANLLEEAAALAKNESLKSYLNLRAEALITDEFDASDRAWLDMTGNGLDLIIGPIENYEDQLFGYKAAYEAYVLVKDKAWSKRLEKYVAYLPELQKNLPVAKAYKEETPGTDSQLNAYDVVYYAGDCNAGSKTIAVNLPNDETIQQEKGTKRSQLKNAMKAKFDKILVPLSQELIATDQRQHITFEAFFGNTMFHEVAHGLGIKNTINNKGTVREALKDNASALEEGKADILGLFMVQQLLEKGVITEGAIMDYYVTFVASIFRSVRFGASSAHGKANMMRFNYFLEQGAFERDAEKGTYRVNQAKMEAAIASLSEKILMLQGDGDYQGVSQLMEEKGRILPELQGDLDRLSEAGIPVDIVFKQGKDVIGI